MRGDVYRSAAKYHGAQVEYNRQARLDPRSPEQKRALERCKESAQAYEEALNKLREGLIAEPSDDGFTREIQHVETILMALAFEWQIINQLFFLLK
jgi:tetratricopeptide (TPR) repeat protein